jgi:MFS family permease
VPERPHIYYGWVIVAAGFTITLVGYAVRNTFTVFYPVIVDEFHWARGVTAIMYSLTMLTYGLVAPVAGGLVDRFDPRLIFSIGGLIIGGGMALCGTATTVWHFYLFYGVMAAAGLSLCGFTPLTSLVTHWFLERRAQIFGMMGAGYAVSLISAPLFQFIIAQYGWRIGYVIVGTTAVLVILPLAILVLKRKPSGAEPIGDAPTTEMAQGHDADRHADWTVRTALKTRTYRLQLAMAFCNIGFAQGVGVAHVVYFLRDIGYEPMAAASIFSLYGVGFIVGTLSSGLSDRYGRVQVFTPTTLLAALAIVMFLFTDSNTPTVVPSIATALLGFGLGISAPACYASIADCFHGRNYGSIQGTAILAMSFGAATGPWLGGYLHDVTGTYTSTFVLAIAILALAATLMVVANPRAGALLR